jgi:Flp pilus assembly protein TadG
VKPLGTRPCRGSDGQAGTGTVELVIVTPVLLMMLCLIVGLGRTADARGRLTGAVRDAARAASVALTPTAAEHAAHDTALADLTGAGLVCQQPQVSTDTTAWQPGGQVRVQIRCTLDLSALVIAGLPGHRTLTADATAPLDRYTRRTPARP